MGEVLYKEQGGHSTLGVRSLEGPGHLRAGMERMKGSAGGKGDSCEASPPHSHVSPVLSLPVVPRSNTPWADGCGGGCHGHAS